MACEAEIVECQPLPDGEPAKPTNIKSASCLVSCNRLRAAWQRLLCGAWCTQQQKRATPCPPLPAAAACPTLCCPWRAGRFYIEIVGRRRFQPTETWEQARRIPCCNTATLLHANTARRLHATSTPAGCFLPLPGNLLAPCMPASPPYLSTHMQTECFAPCRATAASHGTPYLHCRCVAMPTLSNTPLAVQDGYRVARPTFITDEPPAEGSEEAQRLQEAVAEVEQLADVLLERLRTLSQVKRECGVGSAMRGVIQMLTAACTAACGWSAGAPECAAAGQWIRGQGCFHLKATRMPRSGCHAGASNSALLSATLAVVTCCGIASPLLPPQSRRGIGELLARLGTKPSAADPEAFSFWVVSLPGCPVGRQHERYQAPLSATQFVEVQS